MLYSPAKDTACPRLASKRFALNHSLLEASTTGIIVFLVLGLLLMHEHYPLLGGKSNNLFVYLADAFIHGRLYLVEPPFSFDLSFYKGHYYAYWPPLAALLLIPPVSLLGTGFGDRWLGILLSALSTIPAYVLIGNIAERYDFRASVAFRILLTLFFAFGTSNLVLGYYGTHWFMAQLAASLMMMSAAAVMTSKSTEPRAFLQAAVLWAASILSRMHLVLAVPFFAQFVRSTACAGRQRELEPVSVCVKRAVVLIVPLICAFSLTGWYNWARFGDAFDNGIKYHSMAPRFKADYANYGFFNAHYIPRNIYYELLRVPLFSKTPLLKEPGPETTWQEGYSLFYQCPLLLYALLTLRTLHADRFVRACWLSIALIAVPILSLMGTGFAQFGARYLFDVVPFFYMLTIIGARGRVSAMFVALAVTSIVINFHGLHLWGCI
jgi:hypothetical protein